MSRGMSGSGVGSSVCTPCSRCGGSGSGPSSSFGGSGTWGGVAGAAPAQEIPAAIELAPYLLQPAVVVLIELTPLRGGPQTMFLVHEGVDSVEDRALSHGARSAPVPRRSARPTESPRAAHPGSAPRFLRRVHRCPAQPAAPPAQSRRAPGGACPPAPRRARRRRGPWPRPRDAGRDGRARRRRSSQGPRARARCARVGAREARVRVLRPYGKGCTSRAAASGRPASQGPGSAVASIRTLVPDPIGFPVMAWPGRRPSIVLDAEPSAPLTLMLTRLVSLANRRPYSWPSADRSSTLIEMKAGTRTTRGVIRPPSPVNIASVRAGSSSPAPPSWSSGDVLGAVSGPVSVSVSGSVRTVSGSVSAVAVVSV